MKAQLKIKPKLEVIKEEIPHLLVPGEVGVVLELTVTRKDGSVREHRLLRSKSYVRQFLELLWIQSYQVPELVCMDIRDTSDVVRSIPESGHIFACDALADDDTFGVIVGTGTTSPDIDDHKIETIIPTGGGGGQLNYSIGTYGAPASDATTSQFTITRNFANASGGDITVNEIALYVEGYLFETDTDYIFMTIRDVIGGGISVPNGETLTVNYRPQAVV